MALTLEHIQIGWISALPIEALLAEIMLDEEIEQAIALPPNDNNIYTYGRIKIAGSHASHIVAIAQLPLSTTGRASAATVANNMRRTFPNLKFGIMVGIAGGVWTTEVDVRLGDIVVGVPDDGGPGIIQYDHGKAIQEREFVLKGTLNKAPDLLRSAAGLLKRKHMRKPGEYVSLLDNEEVRRLAPRPDVDNLFSAAYVHQGGKSCEGCDKSRLRDRSHRTDLAPKIHYGAIASGDQVVKDAILAEKIQKRHNIICFEMEAAGLDAFPCLVVRGISDYADTHKNDDWHAYAAGTAAAYAKELLSVVPLTAVAELPSTGNTHWNVPRAPNPLFTGRRDLLNRMKDDLIAVPDKNDRPVFVLQGIGGAGKSEAAIKFATENQDSFWGIFWIDAEDKQSIERGFAEIAEMQVPPSRDTTPRVILQWLATTKESWLLILDNCDDEEVDFAKYMPSRGGSVIITTRLTECRVHGAWENIDELGPETAAQLLLKASNLEDGDQAALIPAAESVVSILGEHALALVHAGAYIKKGYCTLNGYIQSFSDEQNRLMEFRPKQQASRYGSVYTTFEVSARALASSDRHDSHLALKLLNILAFLNREILEEDLFIRAFCECQDLENEYGLAWEEDEVQLFKRCTVSSIEDDLTAKHPDGPEQLARSRIRADVSCGWRGAYSHTPIDDAWWRAMDEAEAGLQALDQESAPERSISHNTVQDAMVLDQSRDLNYNHPSAFPHSPPGSSGLADDANSDGGSDEKSEENLGHGDHDDEAQIDPIDFWRCEKVRSTGLVENQSYMRLRAACIRLADLSLIRSDGNRISVHPLVHEWAYTRLGHVARQEAGDQALSVLALCQYEYAQHHYHEAHWKTLEPKLEPLLKIFSGSREDKKRQWNFRMNFMGLMWERAWE